MRSNKAVFGLYKSRGEAEIAINTLRVSGFRTSDVSVLLPEILGDRDFIQPHGTKATEGAAAGAGTGIILGGTIGLLIGIGTIAIPGAGPFIAAGPIMASLAGLGVGGAVGAFSGALIGHGIPEYEAKRYEGFLKEGGILLAVHVDSSGWAEKAADVLESTGAVEVAVSTELKNGWESPRKIVSEAPAQDHLAKTL